MSYLIALVFIPAAFFVPLAYGLPAFWQGDFLTVLALALFLFVLARSIVKRRRAFSLGGFGTWMGIFLCYVLMQYAGGIWGSTGGLWPASVYPYATRVEFIRLSGCWALYCLVSEYGSERRLSKAALGAAFAAAYVVALAILFKRFLGGAETGPGFFSSGWLRYFPAPHPNWNHAAAFLELIVPVALGLGLYRWFKLTLVAKERGPVWLSLFQDSWLLVSFFLFLFLVSACVGTLSKFGIVALLAGIFIFLVLVIRGRRARKLLWVVIPLAFGAVLLAVWAAGGIFVERLHYTPTKDWFTLDARVPFWMRALPIAEKFSLFGAGLGTFGASFTSFYRVTMGHFSNHLLNDYYELLIETGAVGLILWSAAWISFFFSQVKKLSRETSYFRRFVCGGILAGIAAYLLHSALISNLYDPGNTFYVFLMAGFCRAVSREKEWEERKWWQRQREKESRVPLSQRPSIALNAVLFVLCLIPLAFFLKTARAASLAHSANGGELPLRAAMMADPGNASYAAELANLKQKKWRSAREASLKRKFGEEAPGYWREAIRRNPYSLSQRSDYAALAFRLGEFEKGSEALASLAEKMPFDRETLLAYALYLMRWAHVEKSPAQKELLTARAVQVYREACRLPDLGWMRELRLRKTALLPSLLRSEIDSAFTLLENS